MPDTQKNGSEQKPTLSWSTPASSAQKPPVMPTKIAQPTPQPGAKPVTPLAIAPTKGGMGKVVAWVGGIVVVLALIAWGLVAMHNQNAATASLTLNSSASVSSAQTPSASMGVSGAGVTSSALSLTIPNPQDSGLEVAIDSISVSVPTWVVVYEDHNGLPGNALGAGLFGPTLHSGVVDLLRGTLPGQTYLVGESRDDGDRMFSLQSDPPVRDQNGNPVFLQFQTR